MTTDGTDTDGNDATEDPSDEVVDDTTTSGDLDWDDKEPSWVDYDLCQNSGGPLETMDQQPPVSE